MMYKKGRIRWVKKETRDTFTLKVRINEAFQFQPGQFNMLYVPGIGEAPISISSSPDDRDLEHTIRIAGDVTTAISRLTIGEDLYIRGPYGKGWPVEELKDRIPLLIAGGLGIAPLRSLIRYIHKRRGITSERPIILYGAKSPKDILYRDEFSLYRNSFELYLSVDRADPESRWKGDLGFVPDVLKKIRFDPLRVVVFLCGPEIMMIKTIELLVTKGVPYEKIFLSMERNMNCGVGLCGHCMFGPRYVCTDGPVFRYYDVMDFLGVKEV